MGFHYQTYIKSFKTLIENQVGRKVKRLRTDNGLEFCSEEFKQFCIDEGFSRQYTVRNTPEQNGIAERMNKSMLDKARCMLSNATLGKFLGRSCEHILLSYQSVS